MTTLRSRRSAASRRSSHWLALTVLALWSYVPQAHAQTGVPHVVVDRATGSVLVHGEAHRKWFPASLTKLMTIYVALDAIRKGELQAGSPVTMSKTAQRQPPSKMGYRAGTRLRVDTALTILAVKSANDVSVALAEAVSGSVPRFVERMNETASRLGMTSSRFANPHGLHDPGQYVTARDVAILARRLLIDFPDHADMFAIPAIRSGERTHYSFNLLLERFDGADGMKTGFVCASGYNMVAAATRDDRQVIAVLFGTNSQTDRATTAAALLLQGFETETGLMLDFFTPQAVASPPVDQRPTMCSEQARQARYEPAAGQARIDSPLLAPRKISREPMPVTIGGIDAAPSEAYATARLVPQGIAPIPLRRPSYEPRDIDDLPRAAYPLLPGGVPVPTRRPTSGMDLRGSR